MMKVAYSGVSLLGAYSSEGECMANMAGSTMVGSTVAGVVLRDSD